MGSIHYSSEILEPEQDEVNEPQIQEDPEPEPEGSSTMSTAKSPTGFSDVLN